MIYPEKHTILTHFKWSPYSGLEPMCLYEVVQEFSDYDEDLVPKGWKGRYRAYNYFPYDDGLSLAFDVSSKLCLIRLHMLAHAQENIGKNLLQYFKKIDE